MEQLRRDDLISILLLLKLPQLMKFCQTSNVVAQICHEDFFWQLKVQHDIPANKIPRNIHNYKQFYLNYFVKKIQIIDQSHYITNPSSFTIQVYRDETYQSVWNKIKNLTKSVGEQYLIGYFNKHKKEYIYIQPTLDPVTTTNSWGLSLWDDAEYLSVNRYVLDFDGDEDVMPPLQTPADVSNIYNIASGIGNRYINQNN